MTTQVLTQEEITQLKELSAKQTALLNDLGQIEYRLTLLENTKTTLKSQVGEIEEANRSLGIQLTEKYGSGTINIETGEITIE
jgi:hypothetical protein